MMAKDFVERRRHVRIPMVTVTEISIDGGQPLGAMIVDLSARGARVMCQFSLNVGEEVLLKVPILEELAVELEGEVVWSKEMEAMKEYNFGVEYMGGIQFKKINKEIKKFVGRHTGT